MNFKTFLSIGVAVGVAGAILAGMSAPADAKKVRWKMQSTFGSSLPHLGTSGARFVNASACPRCPR